MKLDVKADVRQVEKMLSDLERKAVPKAASRALKRTANQAQTAGVKVIAKEAGMTQTQVKKFVRIEVQPKPSSLRALIRARRATTNLVEWVTPSKRVPGAFRKKPGVTSKAWGKKREYKGSFIARGQHSGKALVFKRLRKDRPDDKSPIESVYGPSVHKMFTKDNAIKSMDETGRKRWPINFQQDLNFYLSKIRGR